MRDRQTIATGLRSAMQAWKNPLELDENTSSGPGYFFTVTLCLNKPAANPALIQAEVTVSFSRNGRVLCETAAYYITETTEALIARRIAERLKGDQAFFGKVNSFQ